MAEDVAEEGGNDVGMEEKRRGKKKEVRDGKVCQEGK